jgi:hypothetical protein
MSGMTDEVLGVRICLGGRHAKIRTLDLAFVSILTAPRAQKASWLCGTQLSNNGAAMLPEAEHSDCRPVSTKTTSADAWRDRTGVGSQNSDS